MTALGTMAPADRHFNGGRRRAHAIQIISVLAMETGGDGPVTLDPEGHAELAWLPYDAPLARVHYRGLKDGWRSVDEYLTGAAGAAPRLRLR